MQAAEWNPLVAWAVHRLGPIHTTIGIAAIKQPEHTLRSVHAYLQKLTKWQFEGFDFAVQCSKSVLVSMALAESHITATHAAELVRLETRAQVSVVLTSPQLYIL